MGMQRITSLFLLTFMGLFGVLETTVAALAPRMGGESTPEACPPEMKMCPMHAGEPCCCGAPEGEVPAASTARFAEGCLGAPESPPVAFPVTPMFRYLLPEPAGMELLGRTTALSLPTEVRMLPAYVEPLTPPPRFALT